MALLQSPPSKGQRLHGKYVDRPPLSAFPHDDLELPLAAVGPDEIRVLVLLSGEFDSPLRAVIELVRLLPDGTNQQCSGDAAQDDVDHDESGDFDRGERNIVPPGTEGGVKYIIVGDNAYPVPLTYDGDGTELTDTWNTDTTGILDYEAISYVWGTPLYSHRIELGGHGILRITESLYRALQRLRFPDCDRRLWADAICINQADTLERSAQVAVMAKVYQQAKGVPVWLGPSEKSDALAFAAIPAYLDASDSDPNGIWERFEANLMARSYCNCCSERFEQKQDIAAEALLALGRLLLRPWFSRLWVVQETQTSARLRDHVTMFCGTHHISYVDLRDAAQSITSGISPEGMLQPVAQFSESLVEQITDMWSGPNPLNNWYADIRERSPYYLLRTLAGMSIRKCSNPLDRVYAVRSLMALEDEPSLVPDYTLNAAEVYRRLVIVLLEVFQRRAITHMVDFEQPWALLAVAGTTHSEDVRTDLPSWVPNFDAFTSTTRGKIKLYSDMNCLSVPQFLPAQDLFSTRFIVSGDHLQVRAKCFAVVQELYLNTEYPTLSVKYSDRTPKADLEIFRAWYARCLQHIKRSQHCNDEVISHSATFLACGIQLAHLPREMEDVEGAVDYSGGWLFPDRWPEDPNIVREHFMLLCATEHEQPDKSRLIARIAVHVEHAVEDYCWVPPQARQGDRVCIVAGAAFPFVVRELPDGCFQMVGDAYLANTTLKQALGGGGDSRFDGDIYEEVSHPATDDWNAENEVMQKLIAEMEWMTLK